MFRYVVWTDNQKRAVHTALVTPLIVRPMVVFVLPCSAERDGASW